MAEITRASVQDTNQLKSKTFNANLNQNAGTYALFTVNAVGNIFIYDIVFYNDVAATGLTSVSMVTDDTTVTTVLASVLLAALTGGKNLTDYTVPIVLPSGKHVNYVIVGNGTGGSIKCTVLYYSTIAGADIN